MAMRHRWLLYQEECTIRGHSASAPATDEGGFSADAVSAPAVIAQTVIKTSPLPEKRSGKGAMAATPRPCCPAMPIGPPGLGIHRPHIAVDDSSPSLLAMVARTVTRKELSSTPAASQSLQDEAEKLVSKGAWDPKGVREWDYVAGEARKHGAKAHVGRIFGIVVEKHPELPLGHPDRKFKLAPCLPG